MSLLVEPYVSSQNYFDKKQIEQIILKLADAFDIRVSWNWDTALLTGSFALLGGALGGYATGRIGAAVGGAIGGAVGYGVSTMVSLREIWDYVKEKLEGLLYVVFNYLRRLDPKDYVNAARVLMACASNKRELVLTILDFLAHELGRECKSHNRTQRLRRRRRARTSNVIRTWVSSTVTGALGLIHQSNKPNKSRRHPKSRSESHRR